MLTNRTQAGAVGIIFTLLMPILVVGIAVTVDSARLYAVKAELQHAVDFAALGVVGELPDQVTDRASLANRYVRANVHSAQVTDVSTDFDDDTATVSASAVAEPIFGKMFGFSDVTFSASATATIDAQRRVICLLLLEPDATGLILSGGATTIADCSVWINSDNDRAADISGGSRLTSLFACVVGSVFYTTAGNADVLPEEQCPRSPDPLADLPEPPVGGCDTNDLQVKTGETLSLPPGTHCGAVEVKSGGALVLQPGIHVFNDRVRVRKDAALMGDDVTLYFSGTGPSLELGQNGTLILRAPVEGVYQGVAIFFSRDTALDNGAELVVEADAVFEIEGAVYGPSSDITVTSSVPVNVLTRSTAIIANSLQVSAGSSLSVTVDIESDRLPPVIVGNTRTQPYLIQ